MALPGHVYVTRGLLGLASSEAELAGVIGHEIGHIFERHTAKRVSRGNLAQIGAVAAAILTGDGQIPRKWWGRGGAAVSSSVFAQPGI